MKVLVRKIVNHVYDRLWLAPQGLNPADFIRRVEQCICVRRMGPSLGQIRDIEIRYNSQLRSKARIDRVNS